MLCELSRRLKQSQKTDARFPAKRQANACLKRYCGRAYSKQKLHELTEVYMFKTLSSLEERANVAVGGPGAEPVNEDALLR